MAVEGVELVVTALTAGAAAGIKDSAASVVKDAYAALLHVVRPQLVHQAPTVVDEHAVDPEGLREALVAALSTVHPEDDEDILAAAQNLLTHIDSVGAHAGKYIVDIRDTRGVQVGDSNTMTITF